MARSNINDESVHDHPRKSINVRDGKRLRNDEASTDGEQSRNKERVRAFHMALSAAWGPQHWWPAQTRFEVIVGAFLTQNTAWTNVERAIVNLRTAGALTLEAMRQIPLADLEQLVRPSGYFRQKAQRLKTFIAYLDARHGGSLNRMFSRPTAELRTELLALNGVGPETADSILLYAGDHPVFVVDAYTRRIVERHGLLPPTASYEEIRALFEQALNGASSAPANENAAVTAPAKPEVRLAARLNCAAHEPSAVSVEPRKALIQTFNEMHALIIGVGKNHCFKTEASCAGCPLEPFLSPLNIAKPGRGRMQMRNKLPRTL